MADATLAKLKTRLNIKVRDGSNITFTDQEKSEALVTAIADPYVRSTVRDTSVTTAANTDSYTVPDGKLLKLGIKLNTYGKPDPIDGWDQYDDQVYLDALPPAGKTLVMIYRVKLSSTDAIPDELQEYVLVLAKLELVKYLEQSLANQFLPNEISMGDLINMQSVLSREAQAWRSKLANQVIEL